MKIKGNPSARMLKIHVLKDKYGLTESDSLLLKRGGEIDVDAKIADMLIEVHYATVIESAPKPVKIIEKQVTKPEADRKPLGDK